MLFHWSSFSNIQNHGRNLRIFTLHSYDLTAMIKLEFISENQLNNAFGL